MENTPEHLDVTSKDRSVPPQSQSSHMLLSNDMTDHGRSAATAIVQLILKSYDGTFASLASYKLLGKALLLSNADEMESYVVDYNDVDGLQHSVYIIMGQREPIQGLDSLLKQVASLSSAPTPQSLKVDLSGSIVPSAYIVLSHPVGAPLSSIRGALSQENNLRVDLSLGASLQSANAIQNDWFGLPLDPNEWGECYSWQECFTLLLEEALFAVEDSDSPMKEWLPIADIRRVLGRAIGFYLFDDVEVPCLVWNVSLSWDDSVSVRDHENVTGLCSWEGALWGDPLMEGAFREPSAAFIEGYGGSPIVIVRQKTKRLWYTLYVALRTLLHGAADVDDVKGLLLKTVDALKDAPCY